MPPPPPIIYNYIIEETLIKTHSLTQAFLAKIPKLALFSAFWDKLRLYCGFRAPLKGQKSAKRFFFHVARHFHTAPARFPRKGRLLSILLFIATLSFTHCKSDDNGGGGGGSKEPEPIGPAIYLWITGCTVLGDMTGGDCGNMTRGVDGADGICESRYETDVASEHRTTIMENHETGTLQHTAFLAIAGDPDPAQTMDDISPQSFAINGKDSLPLRRPDETQIAASWADFFNADQDLDDSISGTEDYYLTGLQRDSGSGFEVAPSETASYTSTYTCEDWRTSSLAGIGDPVPVNRGRTGKGSETGDARISAASTTCDLSDEHLLCITH